MWRSRREDSNRFDLGLLRRFARYRALFSLGHLTRIGLPDSVGATSARLDTAVADVACDLSASTPPTQRVRLVGRLDTMGASQGVLKLELKRGAEVYGLWEGDGPVDWLKDYSNRDVVIEGRVVNRPSGALLRVEVQAIGMATAADDYFRVMPGGRVQGDAVRLARLRPGEGSAYARILGCIPAEESAEDFRAAVEDLS